MYTTSAMTKRMAHLDIDFLFAEDIKIETDHKVAQQVIDRFVGKVL